METLNYTLYVPFGMAATLAVLIIVYVIKSFF